MNPGSRPPLWSVVAMHAVPAVGVLLFGWSMALVLLFYWLENLVSGLIWNRAIRRHHDRTRMRGHYRNQLGISANDTPIEFFPREYRAGALFFTAIHGIFIAVFAFGLLDGAELLAELPWIAALMAASIFLTWEELRPVVRDVETRSFHWLRTHASRSLYQVWAMHMGVVLGGVSLAMDGRGLLLVFLFIALRIVADVLRNRPALPASERRPRTLSIHIWGDPEEAAERRAQELEKFRRQVAEDELPRAPAGGGEATEGAR
ncbi:MAG: hypothetical protein EA422_14340 [Gemmatimonadales bacterium]|nr:MAG: hypothetical protein EA422_14340 [Gemmatimonadales bacterium]